MDSDTTETMDRTGFLKYIAGIGGAMLAGLLGLRKADNTLPEKEQRVNFGSRDKEREVLFGRNAIKPENLPKYDDRKLWERIVYGRELKDGDIMGDHSPGSYKWNVKKQEWVKL